MAGEPLIEALALDIQPALDALDPLGGKLTELVTDFGQGLVDAIGAVANVPQIPVDQIIDAAGITETISGAVGDSLPPPITVEADTSALEVGIADAFDQPRPPIAVEGDTSDLSTAIDDATSTSATVTVEADTDAAHAAIDALSEPIITPVDADVGAAQDALDSLADEQVTISVDADVADAEGSIETLGEVATGAVGGEGDGVGGLSHAIEGLAEVSEIASGEASGLVERIAGLGPGATAAVGGLVAVGAFITEVTHLAADSEAQNRRFIATFGDLAEKVRDINVGGLSISLEDLGKKSATSLSDLESVASKIGGIGKSSGAAGPQIVSTTQNLLALGATIAVNNPRLGDAASVTDRLSTALARGGRALSPYNISLTRSQIIHEAFNETGKKSVQQLTQFELTTAGANLAVAKYGNTLDTEFAKGADNAQVKIKALKIQLEETLAAVGVPLLKPVTDSMSDLVPVAEQVGTALGRLIEVVLPFVSALTPALGPVAGVLGLVADGLDGVSGFLSHIPGPLKAAAVGFGLLALAAVGAADGIIAATIALATNPIGATVLAITAVLAGIGAAMHTFGHDSTAAAAAKKQFDEALFGADAGETLAVQLGHIDTNIKKVVADFIEGQKVGSEFRRSLDGIGGGADGLSTALVGTNKQFKDYRDIVLATAATNGAGLIALGKAKDGLEAQRAGLIESEQAQLASLVSTNQLSDADVRHLERLNRLTDGTINYVAVLRGADLIVAKHAEAQAAATHQAALAGNAYAELATHIAAGSVTALDAATIAEQLGISQGDATSIINSQIKALTDQKDKQKESSAAAQRWRSELAAGTITASQAEIGLLGLGISFAGVTSFVGDATAAVDSFISAATGGLPDAASALQSFEQNTAKAQGELDSATKRQSDVIDSVRQDTQDAYDKIAIAHAKGGKNVETAVQHAEDRFAEVARVGKQKIDAAGIDVVLATDKLNKAAVPQELIDTLQRNLTDIANFEDHLKTIVANGGLALAEEFARQGPQVAAAQAAAFADDPQGTKEANALIGRGEGAKAQYLNYLKTTFGPDIAAAIAEQQGLGDLAAAGRIDADGNIIDEATARMAARASARFQPDFVHGSHTALAAAENALAADGRVSQAAGQKGLQAVAAFEQAFGPVSASQAVKIALTAASNAVEKNPDLKVKTGVKGKEASDELGKKADIKGAVTKAFDSAATIIPQLTSLATAAGTAGHAVGVAFDTGITQGINELWALAEIKTAGRGAGQKAVDGAREAIKPGSPSKVGILLGNQFAEGLAIGVTQGEASVGVAGVHLADTLIDVLQKRLADGIAKAALEADARKALGQIIAGAVNQLPTVGGGISNFNSGITSALSTESQALDTYHKAYATYANDKARLHKLQADDSVFQRQLAAANTALSQANAKLFSDTASGNTAALAADQRAVESAKTRIASLQDRLNTVRDSVRSDQVAVADASKGLTAAQKALATASNPGQFVHNLREQNVKAAQFLGDLTRLTKLGFTDLAKELAAAGPEAAGKLADALAKSPARAKQAEAAIDQGTAFAKSYQATLDKLFGDGTATKKAAAAGTAVGVSLTTGIAKTVNAGTKQVFDELGQGGGGAIRLAFQPEVGDTAAQVQTALIANGPLHVEVLPELASLPPLAPLHVEVIPHLAPFGRVASPLVGPGSAAVASLAATAASTLILDLTVVLEDGRKVTAQVDVPVPARQSQLARRTRAEVHTS